MAPCMYNPLLPPYAYAPQMPMATNGGDSNWEKAFKIYEKLERRQLKKELKKEEENKKNKKPDGKKFRDFTFFETFAILTVVSPWLGPLISSLQHVFVGAVLR